MFISNETLNSDYITNFSAFETALLTVLRDRLSLGANGAQTRNSSNVLFSLPLTDCFLVVDSSICLLNSPIVFEAVKSLKIKKMHLVKIVDVNLAGHMWSIIELQLVTNSLTKSRTYGKGGVR